MSSQSANSLLGALFSKDDDKSKAVAYMNSAKQTLASGTIVRRSVADVANEMITRSGPKNGNVFVAIVQTIMKDLSGDQIGLLFECVKSYPLSETLFDKVVRDSLEKSRDNLRSQGVSEDLIENSIPRRVYQERAIKLKDLLATKFWPRIKNDTKALTWGTIMQCEEMKEFAKVIATNVLGLGKPRFQPGIYYNGFWSSLTFDQSRREVEFRLKIIYFWCLHTAKLINESKLELNDRGMYLRSKNFDPLDLRSAVINGDRMIELSIADSKFEVYFDPAILKNSTYFFKLDTVILVDPKKMMQAWDYRLSRLRNKSDHSRMSAIIVEYMKVLIGCWAILNGNDPSIANEKLAKLDVNSDFVKMYYGAYQYIHTAVRTTKRALFGGSSGPNTRQFDEDTNFEVSSLDEILKKLGLLNTSEEK